MDDNIKGFRHVTYAFGADAHHHLLALTSPTLTQFDATVIATHSPIRATYHHRHTLVHPLSAYHEHNHQDLRTTISNLSMI